MSYLNLEQLVIDAIDGKRKALRPLLWVLSYLYRWLVEIRTIFYDLISWKIKRIPCFVLSVGNIVVGGTGKTPFVCKLLQSLTGAAVVSRGYRSKGPRPLLVEENTSPKVCGDEAKWLFFKTGKMVWVDKNRYRGGLEAWKLGSDCLILEDGFQNRSVKKDMEIVLFGEEDLKQTYFLPRGYLRDSYKKLSRADFIWIRRSTNRPFEELSALVSQYTNARIGQMTVRYMFPQHLQGRKIGAFCGIAKPALFYKALESRAQIVKKLTTMDHEIPEFEELLMFSEVCKQEGAVALVCTEKDLIKCDYRLKLPIEVLKLELDCDAILWNEMVNTIQTGVNLNKKEFEHEK